MDYGEEDNSKDDDDEEWEEEEEWEEADDEEEVEEEEEDGEENEEGIYFYSLRLFSQDYRMAIPSEILLRQDCMVKYDNETGICEIISRHDVPVCPFRICSQSY